MERGFGSRREASRMASRQEKRVVICVFCIVLFRLKIRLIL
jgi:hypothetical protein